MNIYIDPELFEKLNLTELRLEMVEISLLKVPKATRIEDMC